ncbi:PAS domain-containing protein, partial [Escherichia coli]|uniref:PAS domain-containing protein n=1 Tax=Escherichia coli TaxID=562 RepID=UPI001CCBC677
MNKIPSLKTYYNAFKQSSNFMLLVDPHGEIIDVNEMHTVFINQTRDELIGQNIETVMAVVNPDNCEPLQTYFEKVKDQGCIQSVTTYQRSPDDIR